MGRQVVRFYPLGPPDITLHCSGGVTVDTCISATGIPPTSSAHWACCSVWRINQPPPPRHASRAAQPTLTALRVRPHRPPPLRQRQNRTAGARPAPPPSVAPPSGATGAAPGARSRGQRAPPTPPALPTGPVAAAGVANATHKHLRRAAAAPFPPPTPPSTGASGSHPAAPPAAPFLGACAAAAPRTHGGFPTTPTEPVGAGVAPGRVSATANPPLRPTPAPPSPSALRGGAPGVRAASRLRLRPPARATRSCGLCVAVSLPRRRRVRLRALLPTPPPTRACHRVRRPATHTAGARTRAAAPAAGDRGVPGYLHPPRAVTHRFVGGGGGGARGAGRRTSLPARHLTVVRVRTRVSRVARPVGAPAVVRGRRRLGGWRGWPELPPAPRARQDGRGGRAGARAPAFGVRPAARACGRRLGSHPSRVWRGASNHVPDRVRPWCACCHHS